MGRPTEFDRDDAVRTAMHEFWRNGYEACSVKALSERLGITRSSFYNAFGSREALFDRALELYCRQSPDATLGDVADGTEVLPLLTRTFREICRVRATDPEARGCMIINTVAELGGTSQPIGRAIGGMVLGSLSRIEELLVRAVEQRELDPGCDPRSLALAVQNLMIGLNVMCKAVRDEGDLWLAASTTLKGLGLFDDRGLPSRHAAN